MTLDPEERGTRQLEFVRPAPALAAPLAEFFSHLVETGEAKRFHPHPFTREAAGERCAYRGADLYVAVTDGSSVLGYGMLRGWDAGYEVPSLGIALHADARGVGLGRLLMTYLHTEARRRGAPRIRLKVYPDNEPAVALYRSLGYKFADELEDGQLVGYLELPSPTNPARRAP